MNSIIILKFLRFKNYLKNFIILVPIFYAEKIFNYNLIQELFIIFIILNLSASIVYIFNDLTDYDNDIKDSYKKSRPLASKKITKKQAWNILVILSVLLILILLFKQNLELYFFISLYLILNYFYSNFLKYISFVDILCLTSFYLIRILLVIFYFELEISYWLISIIFFIIASVSLAKRYIDINNNINNPSFKSLYKKKLLYFMINLLFFISLSLYIFFSLDSDTVEKFSKYFFLTSIIFMLGILRFLYMLKNEKYPDIIDFFFKDWQFILILILYTLLNFKLIYLSN